MGYYLSVLRKGEMYELEGEKLQFIEKVGKWFYFLTCKKDEWSFDYVPTEEKQSFTKEEINYIKRFWGAKQSVRLKKIGKEKVFPRN